MSRGTRATGWRQRRSSCRAVVLAVLSFAGLGAGPAFAAGPCPTDLFREYDPAHPPRILTAPPIRQIAATPYLDPDPLPAGVSLVYYKLHRQEDAIPDPDNAAVKAVKSGATVALYWSGGTPDGACCAAGKCALRCPADCAALSGRFEGESTTCAGVSCMTGACCDSWLGCVDGLDRKGCTASLGVYLGDGSACRDRSGMCPDTGACCKYSGCVDATAGSCGSQQGRFMGVGTGCADVPALCPDSGACCGTDGICHDGVSSTSCWYPATFAGPGTSCRLLPVPCEDFTGACCDGFKGPCVDGEWQELCEGNGRNGTNTGVFAGKGTRCADRPSPCWPITGACCGNGSCQRVPASHCSGIYLGDGTSCLTSSCAPVTGACCYPGQGCVDVITAAQCAAAKGVYRGDGSKCSDWPLPCEGVTGACCSGRCVDFSNPASCVKGDTWLGYGTHCSDSPPPCAPYLGTCCATAGYYVPCFTHTKLGCAQDYSCVFGGVGTLCTDVPSPCDAVTGACCRAGGCTDPSGPDACAAVGGVYMGDGTRCTSTPSVCAAVHGACCHPTNGCMNSYTDTQCVTAGGTFRGIGTRCSDAPPPCPGTGACCDGSGQGCIDGVPSSPTCGWNGVYAGDGTSCRDLPPFCPQYLGACCGPSSTCQDATPQGCLTGSYAGVGTTCATVPSPCPPLVGACCVYNVGCRDGDTLEDCTASWVGGTYLGNGTTCAAGACATVTGACCFTNSCAEFVSPAICARGRGAYLGAGTSCVPGACAAATGACCQPGVGCSDGVPPAKCATSNAEYAGDGTTCADTPLPCEVGACCLAPGQCRELFTRQHCKALGGTFAPGVLCAGAGC